MRLDNLRVLCELSELYCVEGAEQSVELRSFLVFDASLFAVTTRGPP